MKTDWILRHPFPIGTMVYARQDAGGLAQGSALNVAMRGEDGAGLWFASALFPQQRFSVSDFTTTRPMPAVSEATEDEVA